MNGRSHRTHGDSTPNLVGEEWMVKKLGCFLYGKNIKIQSTSPYNYLGGPKNHHSLAAKYDLLIL
jgi:hypothetical protein